MTARRTELTPWGRKVKKRLIDKGMTQVELALLVGCGKQYLHKILTGERSGRKYMGEIARILGIDEAA